MTERNLLVSPELQRLSTFIDSHIECLAGSSDELRTIALRAAKHIFDWALETEKSSIPHLGTLLTTLSEATPPQTRSRACNTPTEKPRRKIDVQETPLPSLFIQGMNIDQIWQQMDLRATRICENLRALQGEGGDEDVELEGEDSDLGGSEDEDEDEEMDVDEESLREGLSGEEDGTSTESDVNFREESSDDEEDHEPLTSMLDVVCHQRRPHSFRSYPQGHTDLDDGFFSLATFNSESTAAEAKDASKRKLNSVPDDESTDESELDLFSSVDVSRSEGLDDGPELFYNDFFEPPPGIQNRSANGRSPKVRFHERVSVKKIKAVGKGMPVSTMEDDSDEDSDGGDGNIFGDGNH